MKKWMKRISLLLIVGVMIFALCGCSDLDRLRELQLFVEEDGTFYHNNIHYVPLKTNEYFRPAGNYTRVYYLTEPDVPVLLSSDYAIGLVQFSEDGRFCEDYRRGIWFCDEKLYEEVQAKNRSPFLPDTLYYGYHVYTEDGGEYKIYVLSDKEWDAINAVLELEPVKLSDGMYISYDWGLGLQAATKDLLFTNGGPSIHIAGDTFYVEVYRETGSVTYQVPEEYNDIFTGIVKASADAYYY